MGASSPGSVICCIVDPRVRELDRGFFKCQKSREDQQAKTGRNKIDPKAEDAPAATAVIVDRVPAVVETAAATVGDVPAAATVATAAIADASMVRPKSTSIS